MAESLGTEHVANTEPCYCRRCKGLRPTPCRHRVQRFWRYVWCIVSLYHLDPTITRDDRCKKCGTKVSL